MGGVIESVDAEVAPGITVNRLICSGAPCVTERRIMTEVLAGRFMSGETPESIAFDFGIGLASAYDALRFELRRHTAKRFGGLRPVRKRKRKGEVS